MKRLTFPLSLAHRSLNREHPAFGKGAYVGSTLKMCASVVLAALVCGCTSLKIDLPANGSSVSMPQEIKVTESVGFLDGATQGQNKILVDGKELEHFTNVNYSVPPGSTLCCLDPGAHSVSVSGHTSSRTVTDMSNFSVTVCPGCYSCPNGASVHPVFGFCCDNGSCDILASSNFGPWRFPAAASCPPTVKANDCLHQSANGICGRDGTGCSGITPMVTQMVAVSFTPSQSGALKQIHVPIGWRNGSNAFQAWITTDVGGKPGAAVETFPLPNIRMQAFPTRSHMHIFSVAHPNLAAGTTYWLVIGPTAANAVGSWNYSVDDAPSAGSSNFLVNTTPNANGIPQLAGPWGPGSGPLRPAFEIDMR